MKVDDSIYSIVEREFDKTVKVLMEEKERDCRRVDPNIHEGILKLILSNYKLGLFDGAFRLGFLDDIQNVSSLLNTLRIIQQRVNREHQ